MSDRAGLAERLRRLRELSGTGPGKLRHASELGAPEPAARPGRVVAGQDLSSLGWRRAGDYLWTMSFELPSPLAAARPLRLLTRDIDSDARLLFLDIETTGLSGGAGSLAFLVGTGRVSGGAFRLSQYFLADFPGERELIEELSRELREEDVVVSFNGKAFDVPILRSRFALSGRRLDFGGQIDLLYPSRRLFRRLIGSCSLHAIESEVLGVERENDIPGFLVPERYFQYLRGGSLEALAPVFHHHREDVLSLARLLGYIEGLGPGADGGRADRVELGRMMIERSVEGGLELLEQLADGGDRRALFLAARFLRRDRRREDAARLWERAWRNSKDPVAGIELAKFYEHSAFDCERALSVVVEVERIARRAGLRDSPLLEALTHRRERLERKAKSRIRA